MCLSLTVTVVRSFRTQERSDAAVGQCLSAYYDEGIKTPTEKKNFNAFGMATETLIKRLAKTATGSFLEVLKHPIDAAFTWSIGVVTGVQGVIQTIDMANCKLPDFYMKVMMFRFILWHSVVGFTVQHRDTDDAHPPCCSSRASHTLPSATSRGVRDSGDISPPPSSVPASFGVVSGVGSGGTGIFAPGLAELEAEEELNFQMPGSKSESIRVISRSSRISAARCTDTFFSISHVSCRQKVSEPEPQVSKQGWLTDL